MPILLVSLADEFRLGIQKTERTKTIHMNWKKRLVGIAAVFIVAISPIDLMAQDSLQVPVEQDPNRTRLLFAPTARPLDSGQGFVSVNGLFFPYIGVGIKNVAVVGGGISLIPGSSTQIYYVMPKVTFVRSGKLSIAAGSFLAGLTGESGNGGVAYGVATYGTDKSAVTVGSGFLFGGGRFSESPVLYIGAEHQISKSLKLLTENYLFTNIDEALILSAGVRFSGTNLAADFGLFTSPDLIDELDGLPVLPWFSFTYNFTF